MPSARFLTHRLTRWSLTLLLLVLAVGIFVYAALLADLPPVAVVRQRTVRPTSQVLDRNGRLLYEIVDPNAGKQLNLTLNRLPPTCIQATLATEDSRFYLHPGIDPVAIMRAAWQNYRAGGVIISGGSTLTQQLAWQFADEPVRTL